MLTALLGFIRNRLLIAGAVIAVGAGAATYYVHTTSGSHSKNIGTTHSNTSHATSTIQQPTQLNIESSRVETISHNEYIPALLPNQQYRINGQTVLLVSGVDYASIDKTTGFHRIDLKFQATNTAQCFNTTSPDCVSEIGNVAIIGSDNQPWTPNGLTIGLDGSGLTDDPLLNCPDITGKVVDIPDSIPTGQTLSFCMSGWLPPNVTVAGATYQLVDQAAPGDIARWTMSESQSKQKHTAWMCTQAKKKQWSGPGNIVPPACTDSGPFRQVYSGPGYSNASATVHLPPFPQMQRGEGANVYLEAWDNSPWKNPYEAGIQYNPPNKGGPSYQLYVRMSTYPNGGYMHLKNNAPFPHVNPGDTIVLMLETPPSGMSLSSLSVNPDTDCTNVHACMVFEAQDATTGNILFLGGFKGTWWNGNSLTFAHMTTIAQPTTGTYAFDDGSLFGPVVWTNAMLGQVGTSPSSWSGGGTHSWPSDSTRIVVLDPSGQSGETGVIDLHGGW